MSALVLLRSMSKTQRQIYEGLTPEAKKRVDSLCNGDPEYAGRTLVEVSDVYRHACGGLTLNGRQHVGGGHFVEMSGKDSIPLVAPTLDADERQLALNNNLSSPLVMPLLDDDSRIPGDGERQNTGGHAGTQNKSRAAVRSGAGDEGLLLPPTL